MLFMVLSKVHYFMSFTLTFIFTIIKGVGGMGWVGYVCLSALGKLNNAVDMTLIIKLTIKRHSLLMKANPGLFIYFVMPRRYSIMIFLIENKLFSFSLFFGGKAESTFLQREIKYV